jgi:Protein of unknown function (DUF2939)
MRWTLRIAAILAILLVAYGIWPLVGFYKIASAIEARDAAALSKRVDFHALRKSLTKQIVATYLELTGKEKKLGLLGKTLAIGLGTSYAEPIVARLVNEETLLDLLSKGNAGGNAKVPDELAPFSKSALNSGWSTWLHSEYRGTDYYVYLPPDKPANKQFKVKLSLSEWQWKLAGIDLPKPLRVQLAQELVKQRESKND